MSGEFFEVVFNEFKKSCNKYLSEIIALTEKYEPGRYQINLFVSYGYWLNSDNIEKELNELLKKHSPKDWDDFYHSTGTLDYDIETYVFISENEGDKKIFDNMKSLDISDKRENAAVIHDAAVEYYQKFVIKKIIFSHLVVSKHGKTTVYFYLYYDIEEHFFHKQINN